MYPAKPVVPIPSTKARATYVELLRKDSGAQSERERSDGRSECPADGIREDREIMDELLSMGMVREDTSSPHASSRWSPASWRPGSERCSALPR